MQIFPCSHNHGNSFQQHINLDIALANSRRPSGASLQARANQLDHFSVYREKLKPTQMELSYELVLTSDGVHGKYLSKRISSVTLIIFTILSLLSFFAIEDITLYYYKKRYNNRGSWSIRLRQALDTIAWGSSVHVVLSRPHVPMATVEVTPAEMCNNLLNIFHCTYTYMYNSRSPMLG